jgi:hypothetical protein
MKGPAFPNLHRRILVNKVRPVVGVNTCQQKTEHSARWAFVPPLSATSLFTDRKIRHQITGKFLRKSPALQACFDDHFSGQMAFNNAARR